MLMATMHHLVGHVGQSGGGSGDNDAGAGAEQAGAQRGHNLAPGGMQQEVPRPCTYQHSLRATEAYIMPTAKNLQEVRKPASMSALSNLT